MKNARKVWASQTTKNWDSDLSMKASLKGLTLMQLYRKIKKQGRMLHPNLSKEVIRRCGVGPFQTLCLFIPKDGREARGVNWDSGHRLPKNYKFTEHRQTILLFCAAVDGKL